MEKPKRESKFDGGAMGVNKILSGMKCDKGAALNGKTQARINILSWCVPMDGDRGAALNGKT